MNEGKIKKITDLDRCALLPVKNVNIVNCKYKDYYRRSSVDLYAYEL